MLRFSGSPATPLQDISQTHSSLHRSFFLKKEKKKKPLSSFSVDAGKRGPSSHTLNNKSETGYCNGIGNGNGDGDEMFNKQHNSEKWNADSDEEMLSLMEGFHDSFPIIRTYRNDLCNVEICGNAVRSSVLTAMATDQSFTASLNMKNNRPLTVLQTVLPGICGDHSTISTKLFAPSFQVAERAKRLSLPKELSSRDIVHKFFEAVHMQQLSKVYIELYAAGTRRDTSALERDEMVQTVFSFESSSKSALDQFGRAVTLYAISGIKGNNKQRRYLKSIWDTCHWIPSVQSPVRFCMLSTKEIENQARKLKDSSVLFENPPDLSRLNRSWWPVSASVMNSARKYLDKATDNWIYEHLFMHKLQIDTSILDVSVVGGNSSPKESKEILLTHAQVVDLANALDLYYEDRFTLSDKILQCGAFIDFQDVPRSKVTKFLDATTVGGMILGIGIFAWLVAARMRKPSGLLSEVPTLNTKTIVTKSEQSSTIERNQELAIPINEQISGAEMEFLCKLVATKLVEAFSWELKIQSCVGEGAWTTCSSQSNSLEVSTELTGEQSAFIRGNSKYETEDGPVELSLLNLQNADIPRINDQEKLIYQVAISRDGTILGFQPLNRAAVSKWAIMPFVPILYGKQKLAPGFWEWPLKYRFKPRNAVILELAISMDIASPYASVKPVAL